MKNKQIDSERRRFLKTSSIAGFGLLVGFHLPSCNKQATAYVSKKENQAAVLVPNAWIRIDRDDRVTIMVNHSEMGQGISTALPMIVAEELEADWSGVRSEIAPVEDIYKNPAFGTQWTVSSKSVESSWDVLREAGAAVRELLIMAAARNWNVSSAECRAEKSTVVHKPTGRRLRYGELILKTDGLSLPEKIKLKNPDEFKIIGQAIPRLDTVIKTKGSAVFGIDIRIPGMLLATVVHPPVFGSKVKAFNSKKTMSSPGVRQVLVIDTGIAIVADTFWQAKTGMELLEIEWEKSENGDINSESLFKRWAEMSKEEGKTCFEKGDAVDIFDDFSNQIESAYEVPFQAHATPEPMNCTAHVREDGCDIWAPTQNQDGALDMAAKITGLDHELINVHTTFLGGGFGRRALVDYVGEAVQISKITKSPIKVIWTREEDIKHDYYRAATYNVLKAVLDERGLPVAWNHHIVGTEVFAQALPNVLPGIMSHGTPRFLKNIAASLAKSLMPRFISGKKGIIGAGPLDYDIANMRVAFTHDDPGVPLCWWRSVAPSSNCFVVESFIDEIAAVSGKDPYELRYELLAKAPRMRKVLKTAAREAGWGKKPFNGIYQGLASHNFQNTALCFVAEVSVSQKGEIKVHQVVCAVDCGVVINPKIIEAQMQSAIVFGLTATIKSAITINRGETEQSNFDDFPLLRMDEMPYVAVHIVPSSNPPTGIGEAGVPLIAPAVANAIFAATGKRIRKLPILPDDLSESDNSA